MEQFPSVPQVPAFKDRRAGLIFFGVILIAIGCLSTLIHVGTLALISSSTAPPGTSVPRGVYTPDILLYGSLSVLLVWLGCGSIMARRWARPLLLIFAAAWLANGVAAFMYDFGLLPRLLSSLPHISKFEKSVVTSTTIPVVAFMGVFFVLLPTSLVLFYRSPHVRATCEARDPVPRWTDRCPSPVLGLSLFHGVVTVEAILLFVVLFNPVLPFFGRMLTGVSALLSWLGAAALSLYAAWAVFRMKWVGWWLTLILWTTIALSAFITFTQVDPVEMSELMGLDRFTGRMKAFGISYAMDLAWLTVLWFGLMVGYLLYLRGFFGQSGEMGRRPERLAIR